jgi:hypothetical protein
MSNHQPPSRLTACLSFSVSFVFFAIPLFMEKLSSDLLESKIATLDAFLACLEKYESEQLEKHFKDVWNSCKQVIDGKTK